MGPTLEAELRFRAETDEPLELLARASTLGPATLGPAATVNETDRYLDTRDRRLAAAGWACRLRTRRPGATIVSLKGPPQHELGEALHRRAEMEGPANDAADPRSWPPSPARELVSDIAGDRPLEVRVTLEQLRSERTVSVAGRSVGLLSLDRVRIVQDTTELGLLHVVELELNGDGARGGLNVAALSTALAGWPGLVPDPLSKFERALMAVSRRAGAEG